MLYNLQFDMGERIYRKNPRPASAPFRRALCCGRYTRFFEFLYRFADCVDLLPIDVR